MKYTEESYTTIQNRDNEGSFWIPYIDVMAGAGLVFFLFMIIFMLLVQQNIRDIAEKEVLYNKVLRERDSLTGYAEKYTQLLSERDILKDKRIHAQREIRRQLQGDFYRQLDIDPADGRVEFRIRLPQDILFSSGSTVVQRSDVILAVGNSVNTALSKQDGTIRKVAIYGHSDIVPSQIFNSNWGLSAMRAERVVAILEEECKIPSHYLLVVGAGSIEPRNTSVYFNENNYDAIVSKYIRRHGRKNYFRHMVVAFAPNRRIDFVLLFRDIAID